ncbi:MAG: efflux RND transporter periplasmic adaptor subunit [Bacteroidetes bacterium]|nr:MAG: efflux RND transporter periplasmic adaptor subunit [Bacteroidota bacterium]
MNNTKLLVIVILAVGAGLGIGYFLFPGMSTQGEWVEESGVSHEGHADGVTGAEEIWTCSMHPQIRQNEPGQCPICEMDLILLDGNTSNDPLVLQMTEAAAKLLNVQTFVVGEGDGSEVSLMRFTGKVQADERLSSSQVAHIPGRIEQLFVTFTGEEVKVGAALAVVYSPDLILAQRELIEAMALSDVNPALLEAARNKLRFWKISPNVIKEIEETQEVKETFTIYADASGVVTNRRIAVGDYVKRGEPLFDMVDLSRVWVMFDAYEEDLPNVKLNDRIDFYTPSVPNKSFSGRITFVDPFINPVSRVAALRIEINNKGHKLKPEMFVYGTLKKSASSVHNIMVPKTAVLWTGKRSVVYVKQTDAEIPSFEYREIELGSAIGTSYVIVSGLEDGEEVVTNGNFSIDAAAQLNNQASMMNRNVTMKGGDASDHLPDYTGTTPVEFKQQLAVVLEAYLGLKDAFVATDAGLAKRSIAPLVDALGAVDMALLKGDAHMYWMDQMGALTGHSAKIAEIEDVELQRTQFDFLSQALIRSVKVFGIPNETYYVQHCPMANENNGADWISNMTEINNPYFGDKMLKCGTNTDTITKNYKNKQVQVAAQRPPQGHKH